MKLVSYHSQHHTYELIETTILRPILLSIMLCLLLGAGLSACGNKGPLVLPEDDKKSKTQS